MAASQSLGTDPNTDATASSGLIGKAIDNGNTVQGAATSTYDPSQQTVDPATQTVAAQLHSLLSSGSPYLQQAESNAMDTANSRGLLNSSMAAGAGDAAAISAAEPIAAQDAGEYSSVASANQNANNTASQFNAGATNTSNLNLAQAANQSELSSQQTQEQAGTIIPAQTQSQEQLAQKQADIQTGQVLPAQTAAQSQLSAQGAAQDTALQTLKGSQATDLANIEANYKGLMQTSSSAAQLFSNITNNINSALSDPNTSVEQKQAQVNSLLQMLQNSMAVTGAIGDLNLNTLLDFTGVAPTTTPTSDVPIEPATPAVTLPSSGDINTVNTSPP